ncbi:MAG: thioredoxin family protein [Pseudomonadota bacterium]|nr:thioredoxin family protein [Pseudomonadota bacterium]
MRLPPLHGLDLDRTLHDAAGPVLLVITRPGCGACRAVKAALADVEPIEGLTAYEVDATDAPALVEELSLSHLPALWILVGGEPVTEVPASPAAPRLAHALQAAIAGP